MQDDKIPCPVRTCPTRAKSESGLTRHVNSKHGGWAAIAADNVSPPAQAGEADADADRMVWVDGLGIGHDTGQAPDSYSSPHVTVYFVADGLYRRVPEAECVEVTDEVACGVPSTKIMAWLRGQYDPRTDSAAR